MLTVDTVTVFIFKFCYVYSYMPSSLVYKPLSSCLLFDYGDVYSQADVVETYKGVGLQTSILKRFSLVTAFTLISKARTVLHLQCNLPHMLYTVLKFSFVMTRDKYTCTCWFSFLTTSHGKNLPWQLLTFLIDALVLTRTSWNIDKISSYQVKLSRWTFHHFMSTEAAEKSLHIHVLFS